MQVANPFAYLIEQLDGPGRDPVRFVISVIPVHTSSMMLYRIDFKHFFWVPCDFVQRSRLWVSGVWSDKPQVSLRKIRNIEAHVLFTGVYLLKRLSAGFLPCAGLRLWALRQF